ncbi:hypothetical protein [Eleftheria terrae]|uniref:hypothetical protein n=1 Tax=Eleftheria terrae TaxID=1597781 RepID=UPI00263A98CB|nr:hypothetical protein [Eleftheria terrae]WKB54341.1 hypothetical protein N7L95_08125 [Eleftheria terrae]
MHAHDQVAAAIDLRIKQLAAQGASVEIILDRMLGFLPGLRQILEGSTEAELADLYERYVGFQTFACLWRHASDWVSQQDSLKSAELAIPHALHEPFSAMLSATAALEMAFQSCLDAAAPDVLAQQLATLSAMHVEWLRQAKQVINELAGLDIPLGITQYITDSVTDAADRIRMLEAQVLARVPGSSVPRAA